jgi:LysM repeat protein
MKKASNILILAILTAFACTGCEHFGQPKPKATTPTKIVAAKPALQGYIFHTVKSGETMGTISKWYSGDVNRWHEIQAANPQSSTTRLSVGEVLKIPMSMAVVHKQQPNFSTAPKRGKSKKAGSSTSGTTVTSEPVFGPK